MDSLRLYGADERWRNDLLLDTFFEISETTNFFFFSISVLLSRITYYVGIVHLKSGGLTVFPISDFSNCERETTAELNEWGLKLISVLVLLKSAYPAQANFAP
jgi:hypothetical protein